MHMYIHIAMVIYSHRLISSCCYASDRRRSDGLFCAARLAAAARSLPVAVTELGFPTEKPGAAARVISVYLHS